MCIYIHTHSWLLAPWLALSLSRSACAVSAQGAFRLLRVPIPVWTGNALKRMHAQLNNTVICAATPSGNSWTLNGTHWIARRTWKSEPTKSERWKRCAGACLGVAWQPAVDGAELRRVKLVEAAFESPRRSDVKELSIKWNRKHDSRSPGCVLRVLGLSWAGCERA